jgi:hypothetical protein
MQGGGEDLTGPVANRDFYAYSILGHGTVFGFSEGMKMGKKFDPWSSGLSATLHGF